MTIALKCLKFCAHICLLLHILLTGNSFIRPVTGVGAIASSSNINDNYYNNNKHQTNNDEYVHLSRQSAQPNTQQQHYNNEQQATGSSFKTTATQQRATRNDQFLLVATLNGRIYAIDLKNKGQIIWSKDFGLRFSSSVGLFSYDTNQGRVNLIPSLDGGLYFHKVLTNKIGALPIDADSLLKNSHKLGSDFLLSGGRKHHVYGLNSATGRTIYECGLESCKYDENSSPSDYILIIEHTKRIVRAIHPKSGDEKWNFDTSQMRIKLIRNKQGKANSLIERINSRNLPYEDYLHELDSNNDGIDEARDRIYESQNNRYLSGQQSDTTDTDDLNLAWDIPFGVVSARDNKWTHKFHSPIVDVWYLDDGYLVKLDPFISTHVATYKLEQPFEQTPGVYIGMHKDQPYLQMLPTTSHIVERSKQLMEQKFSVGYRESLLAANELNTYNYYLLDGQQYFAQPQIEWKHEYDASYQYADPKGLPYEGQGSNVYHEQTNNAHDLYHQQQQLSSHMYAEEHFLSSGHINPDVDKIIHYSQDHHLHNHFEQPSCDPEYVPLIPPKEKEPNCDATSPRSGPNLYISKQPARNSNIDTFPLAQSYSQSENSFAGMVSVIRQYWKEISALCLASALFLNWLFCVIKCKFMNSSVSNNKDINTTKLSQLNSASSSKDTNTSALDSGLGEVPSPFMSLDSTSNSKNSKSSEHSDLPSNQLRARSSTLRAQPIAIPKSNYRQSESQPPSLSNSLSNFEYNSRYSSDFDSIQRLGRGGFGIVFEAKNKIDDCRYAVKRICLPLEKEARERVMREVRALAKLDHSGIVRYYNAWLETPPDEWLKEHDAKLGIVHSKDFASTDGMYDRNDTESHRVGGHSIASCDTSNGICARDPFKCNGIKRLLKQNSSSPSLDIVFEGSGSIRLESGDSTALNGGDCNTNGLEHKSSLGRKTNEKNTKIDSSSSDSDECDFLQFKAPSKTRSKFNRLSVDENIGVDDEGDEFNEDEYLKKYKESDLKDPFSSTSSSDIDPENDGDGKSNRENKQSNSFKSVNSNSKKKSVKNALKHQKRMRQLNNASLRDNLHIEKVYLYIQMQLCRKDTLKDWLKANDTNRDKTTIFDLFYQIVDAVEYVHSQDLIHRDLKVINKLLLPFYHGQPSNIFFSMDGTVKIGDFGLVTAKSSCIGSSLDLNEYVAESDAEKCFDAVHTEQVGTQLYMSPEQLNGISYNHKVDIFAMGLILLELMVPFKTQMQRVNVLFKARNNLFTEEFKRDHKQEHELVKTLLNRTPQRRPTATEIKQHELLSGAVLSQPVMDRIYARRRTISSNSSNE